MIDRAERERIRASVERGRAEGRLQQSQRLESLGQLAGGVAHDFNNLLSVILNYTAFIGEEVSAAANEPDGERWVAVSLDVEQVKRAADRAARLTQQLLTFGRREVVRPRVLNLNDVIAGVEQLLRQSIGAQIELLTSLSPNLRLVLADPGQLEQVLVNLVVNSRDAMPAGGTLTIDTENVDLAADSALSTQPYVRLRVTDTGSGMERSTLDRVFEPFFTTKAKGDGYGLGLATVYGIVTQAAGDVRIYSKPGLGTTVSVLFPATDRDPRAAAMPVVAPLRCGGETVLVVEDEDAMREVTTRILTRNGYQVLGAASGAEAIERALEHPGRIDLLLTDVVMPHLLGKDVAEQIAALRPEIRVLYMSGYAHPALTSQGTLDADVSLVEKPFSEQTLLARIDEALGGPVAGRD